MAEQPDILNAPPFPTMDWTEFGWWIGSVSITLGEDADLNVAPPDLSVSRLPSDSQRDALLYHLENGEQVAASVFVALREYYHRVRPRDSDILGDESAALMPAITGNKGLQQLIDLVQVHIHPWTKSAVSYVGLQFACDWDREHGLGIMMHNDRVVDIGGADASFAWAPDEADNET